MSSYLQGYCGCTRSFRGRFLPGLDPTFYTISLVAAALIMIPICLALFFWSLNPPNSDIGRRGKSRD